MLRVRMSEGVNSHGKKFSPIVGEVRKRCVEATVQVGEALDKYHDGQSREKFVWFLGEGSLLGAYRLGGILPHDYDLDLTIMYPDLSLEEARAALKKLYQWLKPELVKLGLMSRFMNRFDVKESLADDKDFQPGHCKDKIYIFDPTFGVHDGFTPEDEWYRVQIDIQLVANCSKDSQFVRYAYNREDANIEAKIAIPKESIITPSKGLSTIKFEGRLFPAPCDLEGFLTALYGFLGKNAVFDSETCKYRERTSEDQK